MSNNKDFIIDENGVLTKYVGKGGDITIPNSVTSIGMNAFYYCSGLTSVTIPDSVKVIERYAFSGCTEITTITIPSSITKIGGCAFSNCIGLKKVNITDLKAWLNIIFVKFSNPLEVAHNLYLNNQLVTDLVIPNGVKSINNYAFSGCTGIKSINIPDSVNEIQDHAFVGCTCLNSIVISENNSKFDSRNNCKAIIVTSNNELVLGCKNTVIPNNVTKIGSCSFKGCTGMTSVSIPNSVTEIGESAFAGCTGLKKVNIADLKSWCKIKFDYDSNPLEYAHNLYLNNQLVTDLVIPNEVESINSYAFSGCTGLTSITIPDSVTKIGKGVFCDCSNISEIQITNDKLTLNKLFGDTKYDVLYNILSKSDKFCEVVTKWIRKSKEGLLQIIIEADNITALGNALNICSKIKLDDLDELISQATQNNKHKVTAVLIDYKNKKYNTSQVEQYEQNKLDKVFGVKELSYSDYQKIYKLSKQDDKIVISGYKSSEPNVIIPEKITKYNVIGIGEKAFRDCKTLETIVISEGITKIGKSAFEGCTQLTTITIPKSVKEIGSEAFYCCKKICIYCNKGSYAERYAKKEKIKVENIN